jgi:hypothetical protein
MAVWWVHVDLAEDLAIYKPKDILTYLKVADSATFLPGPVLMGFLKLVR